MELLSLGALFVCQGNVPRTLSPSFISSLPHYAASRNIKATQSVGKAFYVTVAIFVSAVNAQNKCLYMHFVYRRMKEREIKI